MTAIQDSAGRICTASMPCPVRKPVDSRLRASDVGRFDDPGDDAGQVLEGEQAEGRHHRQPLHDVADPGPSGRCQALGYLNAQRAGRAVQQNRSTRQHQRPGIPAARRTGVGCGSGWRAMAWCPAPHQHSDDVVARSLPTNGRRLVDHANGGSRRIRFGRRCGDLGDAAPTGSPQGFAGGSIMTGAPNTLARGTSWVNSRT